MGLQSRFPATGARSNLNLLTVNFIITAMSFKVLVGSIIVAGLINTAVGQPGITFDAALHCWVNVTSSMNLTYTPEDFDIINEYLNETVFKVVDELPVEEQGPTLLELEEKMINDMYYTIEVPVTLLDFHRLNELVPGSLFARYGEAIMTIPDLLLKLVVIGIETSLHTCIDGEDEPQYRFILRHIMEEIAHFIFEAPGMTEEAIDQTLSIIGAGLTAAWEAIDDVGIDFNTVALEMVEGLLLAYDKYATEEFDIRMFAEDVIAAAQAIVPEDTVLVEADVIIKNATDILGIEINA